jgi:hypothetical protein
MLISKMLTYLDVFCRRKSALSCHTSNSIGHQAVLFHPPRAGGESMRSTHHWKALIVAGALALALLAAASPIAVAEERSCAGTLGAITVDNLRVPPNATCRLTGTRVQGTVKVESNATLYASSVTVVGNVQAENAARVELLPGSVVGGSVQIVQSGAALIAAVRIEGDLFLDANDRFLAAIGNRIGGNLQAFQNTGALAIIHNTIDGNLQCKANTPAPFGGQNVVQGNKEDQCANLTQKVVYVPMLMIGAAGSAGASMQQ